MSLRQICFTIMPFGKRPVSQPGATVDRVDFDRLWEAAFRPAIDALGYEPVRANEDIGALIITEMIERIVTSELVIADCTIPNVHTFYYLGIRHALRETGSVLTCSDWARPAFDIDQMRQIRYPLPGEYLDDQAAAQIQAILMRAIPHVCQARSTVFDVKAYPASRYTSLKKTLEELSSMQAELLQIRSAPRQDRGRRILELRDRVARGGRVRTEIELEILFALVDAADWKSTLQFIESLPEDVKSQPVVQEQRALAQSKTGDLDGAIGALRELIIAYGDTSYRRGLLAGLYKQRWLSAKLGADLNAAIAEYEKAMTLDLNDYYPASNLPRLYHIRNRKGDDDRARTAATITMMACGRARTRLPRDEWLLPTMLGAAFDSGNVEKAQELADEVAVAGPSAWKLETTIQDLELAISFHDGERAAHLSEIVSELKDLLGP